MKSNYSREERQRIVSKYIQSGKSQTIFSPECIREAVGFLPTLESCAA